MSSKEILKRFPDIVLIVVGAILLSGFIYTISRYERYIGGTGSIIIYFFVPAISSILVFSLLKLPQSAKSNAVLLIISISFCLYLVEGTLYYINGNIFAAKLGKQKEYLARKQGLEFDSRSKLEVIKQFRNDSIDTYPSYSFNMGTFYNHYSNKIGQEVVPIGGIARTNTVLCNESGQWAIYESDEHGFRNPKNLYMQNHVYLMAVGDSFVHGSCVNDDEHIFKYLRNKFGILINLGTANSGPLAELAAFREYIEPLRPKIVLWFYYEGNDIQDLRKEKQSPLLKKYLDKKFSQNLINKQKIIDSVHRKNFKTALNQIESQSAFFYIAKLTGIRSLFEIMHRIDKNISKSDIDALREILELAKTTTTSWGGKLYFVYLPEWKRFSSTEYRHNSRDKILMLVHDLDLPLIDIYPTFLAHNDPMALFPFRLRGHYNKDGYKLVAETIITSIDK